MDWSCRSTVSFGTGFGTRIRFAVRARNQSSSSHGHGRFLASSSWSATEHAVCSFERASVREGKKSTELARVTNWNVTKNGPQHGEGRSRRGNVDSECEVAFRPHDVDGIGIDAVDIEEVGYVVSFLVVVVLVFGPNGTPQLNSLGPMPLTVSVDAKTD